MSNHEAPNLFPDTETCWEYVLSRSFVELKHENAWHVLCNQYDVQLRRWLSNWCWPDEELAADVHVETLARLRRKLESFQNKRSYAGWLSTIARNVLHEQRRRNRRRPRTEAGDPDILPDFRAQIRPDAADHVLRRALSTLNEDQRLAIELVELKGKSQGEAAKMLNVSQATVSRRLATGLIILRRYLISSSHIGEAS